MAKLWFSRCSAKTLTVKSVYTAAGSDFPSSRSYHSTKAQSPQSAALSGFTVPGRAATTDHTHSHTHRLTQCTAGLWCALYISKASWLFSSCLETEALLSSTRPWTVHRLFYRPVRSIAMTAWLRSAMICNRRGQKPLQVGLIKAWSLARPISPPPLLQKPTISSAVMAKLWGGRPSSRISKHSQL